MPDNDADGADYAAGVLIPACAALGEPIDGNTAAQVLVASQNALVRTLPDGSHVVVTREGSVVPIAAGSADDGSLCLRATTTELTKLPTSKSLARAKWRNARSPGDPTDVLASFERAFAYEPVAGGLRPSQNGALHAVLGYWTTGAPKPATVVMPTGAGKTDTMIALFVAASIERLLVVVPSDALRTQVAGAFETLGVLQERGCVGSQVKRPVVGRITHSFSSAANAKAFASQCNVAVATVSVVTTMPSEVRKVFLDQFTALFVDEAHHVAADQWREIRDTFEKRRVVQFTATPYRQDGKHLGGRMVYAYPLSAAQRDGIFADLNYISVHSIGGQDEAIADKALVRLRKDLAADQDHVLMARVKSKTRANDILKLYQRLAPDLNPVVAYSGMSARQKRAVLAAVGSKDQQDPRTSRVLVCVNMYGEGFDLPQLKVAAIHDAHKSLGITLQFIGRFTRTAAKESKLGSATVVVGRPDRDFDQQLRALYAQDSDWNTVINDLTERAVGRQQELSDFEDHFGSGPDDMSIQSLEPKMSAAVFRVPDGVEWIPEAVYVALKDVLFTDPIAINQPDGVMWFVTQTQSSIGWGQFKTLQDTVHTLYVLYFDRQRHLLYLNSSDKSSMHEELAKSVCPDAELIRGETVYRVMAALDRLIPTNVGLLDTRSSARRFSFHVGADVGEAFALSESESKSQTHIAAHGFDRGDRVTVGVSNKGRIWSHLVADDLPMWMRWCENVGTKLLDDTINIDAVMKSLGLPRVEVTGWFRRRTPSVGS